MEWIRSDDEDQGEDQKDLEEVLLWPWLLAGLHLQLLVQFHQFVHWDRLEVGHVRPTLPDYSNLPFSFLLRLRTSVASSTADAPVR